MKCEWRNKTSLRRAASDASGPWHLSELLCALTSQGNSWFNNTPPTWKIGYVPHKEFVCNPVSEFARILMLLSSQLGAWPKKGGRVKFQIHIIRQVWKGEVRRKHTFRWLPPTPSVGDWRAISRDRFRDTQKEVSAVFLQDQEIQKISYRYLLYQF